MKKDKDTAVGYGMLAIAILLVLALIHGWIPL